MASRGTSHAWGRRALVGCAVVLAALVAAPQAGADPDAMGVLGHASGSGSADSSGSAAGSASGGSGSAAAPIIAIDVTGRVIDALGRPVAGASVSVDTSALVVDAAVAAPRPVTTDKLGRYRLAGVPRGAGVVIQKPGFATVLAVATAARLDDAVLVSEQQETIEVHGEGPPSAPGAAKLDRGELERIPGTGDDLLRSLNAMPGVVNSQLPVGYSGLTIRGASPQDSKILVDGFDVPGLYHDIAFRSIIPTEAIDKLDYIPGGFDVAYGRASSGIVAVTTRPGADHATEQAEVSVIDGGAIAQGADGDLRYMVAARRSLIDLILPELIPSSVNLSLTTVPRYYDGQLRLDYRLSDRWDLQLSSFASDDLLELYTDKAQSADQRFYNLNAFDRTTVTGRYHAGAWTASVAVSGLASDFVFNNGVVQHVHVQYSNGAARGEVSHLARTWQGLLDVVWRAGAEVTIGRAFVDFAVPQEQIEGQPMTFPNSKDTSEQFTGVVWTPDFAAWTAVDANLSPAIKVTAGVRVDEFARIHASAIQPRGEWAIKVAPRWTVRLTGGAFVRPPEYQSELLDDALKPEHALQSIAALQYDVRDGIRVQGSLYYTDRFDLITYAADGRTLVNTGRGTTYGAELLATLRSGPWFGFLSYSYSHSTRVDAPGDPERLFDYDQPHSLNLAASRRWRKWQLGGRFELYSGLPFTPVVGAVLASDQNVYVPIYGPINSERVPIHHQLDLRLDRYWKWGRAQMSWFVDVQNVYLDQSVVSYFYNFDYTQRSAFTGIPIIPSVGIKGVL